MTASMPAPAVLEDGVVKLEPLTPSHIPELFVAGGGDDEVWHWTPAPTPHGEAELAKIAAGLIHDRDHVPFAVVLKEIGRAVGWTAYIDTPRVAESIEIGWTWYGRAVWTSPVNTLCKILLIDHAFGTLGVNRVQLTADAFNLRSQAEIRRIGGVLEGVLRRQRRDPDGSWRDTACFGILDDEWPAHRARLTG